MNIVFSIDAPFLTPAEFAARTGQTQRAVEEQLKNGQLPLYELPCSAKAKDKAGKRNYRKLLVDNMQIQLRAMKDAGFKVTMAKA